MRIHLSRPHITELERRYVQDALESGWVAPLGPHVDAFEREMAEFVGVDHALALSSGTAALHLALLTMGVGPGRVVIVPTLTFAATVNAVLYTGATPVFVDACAEDGNVDPELLATAVDKLRKDGADIGAIITVDLFGRACAYDDITALTTEQEIPLLEDAAEALGSRYKGRAAGSFGTLSAISFNGNKIMTTSGGGMLLGSDASLLSHARKLSTQAREPVPWYEHAEVGYNYRLSNILAALGRAQLQRLPVMMERRQVINRIYRQLLASTPVQMMGAAGSADGPYRDNFWLTWLLLPEEAKGGKSAGCLIQHLNCEGIEARHVWKPLHLQPAYDRYRAFTNGTSEDLFQRGVVLPSGSELSDTEIEVVAHSILEFLA